jgi:hypothetical protein
MEKRKALIKKILKAAAALLVYYAFVRITGLSLPCVFHEVTGLKCPGCGITHMLLHAAKFELAEAFACNQLLFFMLPFLGLLLAVKLVFLPKWLENGSRVFEALMWGCCALLVIFGIVRNLI